MKAKIYANQLRIDGTALEYIRLVKKASPIPRKEMDESHRIEAKEIIESVKEQDNSGYELDINIEGKNLIDRMDNDFEDMGLVPYHFSKSAAEAGEYISLGTYVIIPHDDRKFRTVAISKRHGAVRLRDANGNEYLLPWQLVRPWRE